jgi:hypothetical protein
MLERLEGARLAVSARARLALWHGRRQLAGGGMVSTYSRTGPRWHHVHTEQGHVDHFTREGGNDVEGVVKVLSSRSPPGGYSARVKSVDP